MEDIIYTLLVIGWIVYGVVKANSKNKKKPAIAKETLNYSYSEENIENKPSPVSELLNGIFNPEILKEDENTHPYTKEFDVKDLDDEEKPIGNDFEKKLDSYSGSDHITSVFTDNNSEKEDLYYADESVEYQSENKEESRGNKEFNLREAIIHQVILERPY